MPYIDLSKDKLAFSMIQTVRNNYAGFTRREVLEAKEAREVQAMIGHPTDAEFKDMVRVKTLENCPTSPQACTHANHIY